MEQPEIIDIKTNCMFSIMFSTNAALLWEGLTITLGSVHELRYEIDPFPHAWRVKFYNDPKEGERGPWFDTTEEVAMKIEQAIEKAKASRS